MGIFYTFFFGKYPPASGPLIPILSAYSLIPHPPYSLYNPTLIPTLTSIGLASYNFIQQENRKKNILNSFHYVIFILIHIRYIICRL